jgi:DNA modification methylase
MLVSQIKPNPNNPRLIKDDKFKKLVQSIKDFPDMLNKRPIVVNKDMIVLGGNMRLKACIEAGMKDVPVIVADWSEEQQREFIIKDNVSGGEWDWDVLANDWDADQLTEWGLDVPDIQQLDAKEDDFEVPEGGIETDIVLGDLFEIGEHRLLCGDSTDSDAVARLMDGQKADISFTSPPYNAGENSKLSTHQANGRKYENYDDNKTSEEYLDLLKGFTSNALMNSIYTFVNVQSIAGNKTTLIEYLHEFKEVYADTLIWQKQNAQPAMAKNVLNSQFEYIHCFSEKANRAIGVKQFRGTLSNVIQIQKQNNNEVKSHNATFPVAFAAYFVENFSIQSILDLFLGSGTTMVAAHQLKRKCYGMELDPKYCQVIVDRMIKLDSTLTIKLNGKEYVRNNVETTINA